MNPLDRITPAELGRRLKAARLMAGITEAQAAAAIGADESALTALKRGEQGWPYTIERAAGYRYVLKHRDLGTIRAYRTLLGAQRAAERYYQGNDHDRN